MNKLSGQDAQVKAAEEAFGGFVRTIAALRDPQKGCPWDLEQDHKSLRRFMLEEAYEAAEAMLSGDDRHLIEELGDVLLQVVLNAQVAADRGGGDIVGLIEGINAKMIRRHPHVFAPAATERLAPAEVKKNWEEIKQQEKRERKGESGKLPSVFAEVRKVLPALTQAYKIGKRAKTIDFDWDNPQEVLNQVRSELLELEVEMQRGDRELLEQELGDVFFSLAQLARHLGFEPEDVAQRGNSKFLKRFSLVEALAAERGLDPSQLAREELEKLWLEAKDSEGS